ncbi:BlaI/MecI/CopY family transcriptional regulator [uncultured Faecalicoccus sp.]|uniref:BlaI/MecI/CopY family transcriptional regulator n=1 Tax=uncultured Faecalicoccus sp. TaxID=1971760 RepID=UPI002612D768|nr:BlaI/MecI/CopY family transcriptional regulator [uncultured Faecalicoccus sp.]
MKERLSKRESDIMETLWNSNEPLSANDILTLIPDITMNTIQPNLKKLMKKGFIKVTGVGYTKNSITRQFSPIISQATYLSAYLNDEALKDFALRFIEQSSDDKELKELRDLIDKRRKELKK